MNSRLLSEQFYQFDNVKTFSVVFFGRLICAISSHYESHSKNLKVEKNLSNIL